MKRRLKGLVIADRMDKTRVVEIIRDVVHPLYKKRYKVAKRFYAHDADNSSKIGDRVTIEETRPLSKLKRWKIIELIGTNTTTGGEEKRPNSEEETPPSLPVGSHPRRKGKVEPKGEDRKVSVSSLRKRRAPSRENA